MCLEIKFEAFCNEFKKNYVGEEDDDELLNHTVEKIREDLEKIKMIYMNRATGRMIYTSPETVFKKMNAFIELLPTDASGWSFCLPWLFFAALPSDLQEEMKNRGFTRPPVATLNTKKLQARALRQCRDSAVKTYNKLQETKKQVRAMIQGQQCIPGPGNNCNYLSMQEEEDEIGQYGPASSGQAHMFAYQQKSRAETTMYNAHNQRKHQEMLPAGFQHRTKVINGAEYPCHPNDETKWSAFPVGFPVCFYCGDTSHGFQNCQRKEESDAVTVFHWNLHCHKPELWFKHKERRASSSGSDRTRSVQFQPQLPTSTPSIRNSIMGRGRSATLPAWQTRVPFHVISQQDDNEEDDTYATGDGYMTQYGTMKRQFVTIVKCHNFHVYIYRSTPRSIAVLTETISTIPSPSNETVYNIFFGDLNLPHSLEKKIAKLSKKNRLVYGSDTSVNEDDRGAFAWGIKDRDNPDNMLLQHHAPIHGDVDQIHST